MKKNNILIKMFLTIYLIVIIAGVILFERISFKGHGLESTVHSGKATDTQAETKPVIHTATSSTAGVSTTSVAETTPAVSTTSAAETTSATSTTSAVSTTSAPETKETLLQTTEETQTKQPAYIFANGHMNNPSTLKEYTVTGASYVNMHIDKTGSSSFASVPGGTTGSIISVGEYYSLIDYNGTKGYVYNSFLSVR